MEALAEFLPRLRSKEVSHRQERRNLVTPSLLNNKNDFAHAVIAHSAVVTRRGSTSSLGSVTTVRGAVGTTEFGNRRTW
jgi:hypothetical protein